MAWLFNIRGRDILFNAVAIAAAFLTQEDAFLFIDDDKFDEDVQQVKNESAGGMEVAFLLSVSDSFCPSRAFPYAFSAEEQQPSFLARN